MIVRYRTAYMDIFLLGKHSFTAVIITLYDYDIPAAWYRAGNNLFFKII